MVSEHPSGHHLVPSPASKHQILYFDAVRALSAQMVLVGHSCNIFLPGIFMALSHGRFRTSGGVFYMQNLGVLLFFVLSGFLVSRSAMTKMSSPAWGYSDYLLERTARIFVPLVPAILLVSVLDRVILHGHDTPFIRLDLDPWTLVANLTMLFNNPVMEALGARTGLPLDTRPIGTAAPFWSVVIEFWIYIAFGLILLRVIRDRRLGVLGILSLAFSLAVVVDTARRHEGLVLAWVVGMFYAWGASQPWFVRRLPHRVLGVVGLVTTPWLLWQGDWNVYHERVALTLGLAVLSTWLGFANRPQRADRAASTRLKARMRSAVAYLSDTSYSLYLVHFSLLIYLRTVPWLAHHPRVAIPVAFVLANAVALLYWYLIERHYPTVRRAVRRSGLWPTAPGIRAAHPLGDPNPAESQTDESPEIRAGDATTAPVLGQGPPERSSRPPPHRPPE